MAGERFFAVNAPVVKVASRMNAHELLEAIRLNRMITDSDTVRLHEELYNELIMRFTALIKAHGIE